MKVSEKVARKLNRGDSNPTEASPLLPNEPHSMPRYDVVNLVIDGSGKSTIETSVVVDAHDETRKAKRSLRSRRVNFKTQFMRRQSRPLIRSALQNSSNLRNMLPQGEESNAITDNDLITPPSSPLQLRSLLGSRFASSNPSSPSRDSVVTFYSSGSSVSNKSCIKVHSFSKNFYRAVNVTMLTYNIKTFKSLFLMKEKSHDFFWYATLSLVACSLVVQVGMAIFSLKRARDATNACDENRGWRWRIKYLFASVIMVINIIIAALSPV